MADPGEAVRTFFEAYARATSQVDAGLLASAYAEQFMFAGPGGVQAVRREDFLKIVPRRKAFLTGLGLRRSELRRLEETVLGGDYVQVKAYWAFMFEKDGRQTVDEGAATYILRRAGEQLQIVFQLDHQDLTKRAQELGRG